MDRIKRMTVLLVCSFACLFALVSFCATHAYGQAVSATLSGRITDASGGSIAKASVTILNAATGSRGRRKPPTVANTRFRRFPRATTQ